MEHFANLKPALQEIGRVVRRDGAVFVAVPDATTWADRIYRNLYRSHGGHVNLFDSPAELAEMLSWYFGLPHVATRTLYCSFPFLNRRNTAYVHHPEMRFRGFPERFLALLTGALRLLDQRWRTRASVYGWALYFGAVPEPVDPTPRTNVCVRCGQGHPAAWLAQLGVVKQKWNLLRYYHCPACGVANVYTRDHDLAKLL